MKSAHYLARIALLGALSAPALVHAEATPTPAPVTYGFDDELVKGDLVRPDAETLLARKRGTRASLIEVRSSYLNELLKSVEDL